MIDAENENVLVYYECPNVVCRYRITEIQFETIRHDYGCPRCGGCKISHFIRKTIELGDVDE